MLNFNGWKIGFIITVCLLGIIYALPNFFNFQRDGKQSFLPGKTINLGLDLQGGSYLLLEADIDIVLNERLEAVNEDVLKAFKEYEIVLLDKILSDKKLVIEFESNLLVDKAMKVLRQSLGSDFNISSNNSNKILIEYSELATKKICSQMKVNSLNPLKFFASNHKKRLIEFLFDLCLCDNQLNSR